MRDNDETDRLLRQKQVSLEPVAADRNFSPLESFHNRTMLTLSCAVAPKPPWIIF